MKNLLIASAITIAFTYTACIPDTIDIDVTPADPELCIASVVVGNNSIVIGLTRSYSPLESSPDEDTLSDDLVEQILVTGAIVTISHGTDTDTLYELSPGIYASVTVPIIEGETYTLRAKDPQMGLEVWAATIMQASVALDTVYPNIVRTAADTMVYMHIRLTDFPVMENYYVVNFVKKVQGDTTFDINSIFAAGSNEVLTEFELYDDNSFDNGVIDKDVHIWSATQTDTIAVTVSAITKGYYEFLTAMKRSSSVFNQLTGEPITYPTNVNGGHGYFTMHRVTSTIFDLNLY